MYSKRVIYWRKKLCEKYNYQKRWYNLSKYSEKKERGTMRILLKKDLVPFKDALYELEEFLLQMDQTEYHYFYRQIERMKNNVEICMLIRYVDWDKLEEILLRDWNLIKQMYNNLWKLESLKDKYRVLQLLSLVEWYLNSDENADILEYSEYIFYN